MDFQNYFIKKLKKVFNNGSNKKIVVALMHCISTSAFINRGHFYNTIDRIFL